MKCKFIMTFAAALMLVATGRADAAPKKFDCRLTVLETKAAGKKDVSAELRSVVVVVDELAKSVAVQQNGSTRPLDHVTMSEHNINGYLDDLSLSVDLSTWKIALQAYKSNPDWQSIEFGTCVPSAPSPQ